MDTFSERKIDFNGNSVLIFWAKLVSSETESLLTSYTKHTFYELQFPIDGKIVMNVEKNNDITVSANEFIVIPPDTYHQIIDADSNGKRFIMAFSFVKENATVKEFFNQTTKLTVKQKTLTLQNLLDVALSFSNKHSALSDEIFIKIINAVLLELINAFVGDFIIDQSLTTYFDNHIINEIYLYIKQKRGINVTLKSISKTFGYSERHLNRLFVANIGKTITDVISHEKLKRIEELVTITHLSLSEIATVTGFCDGYAMNKFFKRYTKTNLSQYRKISQTPKKD